ncbi:unnamed protein product [[Candida] boidinii]|nr:unnamed protein product [[Candida] boidinii]GMF36108.1 unnamed protein product [[Candida] boidinii]
MVKVPQSSNETTKFKETTTSHTGYQTSCRYVLSDLVNSDALVVVVAVAVAVAVWTVKHAANRARPRGPEVFQKKRFVLMWNCRHLRVHQWECGVPNSGGFWSVVCLRLTIALKVSPLVPHSHSDKRMKETVSTY